MHIPVLVRTVCAYYRAHKRSLPWREHISGYGVLVSEYMLQQTQVSRVLVKYPSFLQRFPTMRSLVSAHLSEVLGEWQGLGYNRRAKYLHESVSLILSRYGGVLPDDPNVLRTLPGIGHATACAIVCYTYDKPVHFVETNIRRVVIHHCFPHEMKVHDRDIYPLVVRMVSYARRTGALSPRELYYALMDYGSHLLASGTNANRKSAHYVKQSPFAGSTRQIRGRMLREYLAGSLPQGISQRESDIWNTLKRERLIE